MIISLNWLKQFVVIDRPVDELVELIGARLVEIEDVIKVSSRYEGVVIAKVVKAEQHPDADKLKVVEIDDGHAAKHVKRLHNGHVQVVCGAPNVREGMLVAWIPPGATVPATYGKEDFILEARKLRGVVSNGMLASARELAIGDSHEGIVEIDKELEPGTSFVDAYELDDYLLDVENKSLTHRPDCFGLIGFAREVAAVMGKEFTSPEWLMALEPELALLDKDVEPVKLHAKVENQEISPRYQVIALDNVDATGSSPFIIQSLLARVGIRPISTVVDITNYLMYLTGQPLHAFDLDKVIAEHPAGKAEIVVREGKKGETLKLLDGRVIDLVTSDIVICAGSKPIALAGAMGGATTEIDANTKRVLLESATFDLYRLRTTQMRHGIFSEAITRFTKGQSPVQTAPVLASATRMLCDLAGARRISDVVDTAPKPYTPEVIVVDPAKVNATLGTDFTLEQMKNILMRTEFKVQTPSSEPQTPNTLHVTVPYWRGDIHIPEDIAEEVGRIDGFDNITPELPVRPFRAVSIGSFDAFRTRLREALVRGGANELLTYNFLSSKMMQQTGEKTDDAFRLVNSLSPELEYYRMSLLPSLLAKVHPNHKLGYDTFGLFELNKTHSKKELGEDKLPIERDTLAFVWSANDKLAVDYPGAPYYRAKKYLDFLGEAAGVTFNYELLDGAHVPRWAARHASVFEPKRSALVSVGSTAVGIVGEMRAEVARNFKLPSLLAGFELDARLLHEHITGGSPYRPLSRYPGTSRDICLRVDQSYSYGEVEAFVRDALKAFSLETHLMPIDVYQKDGHDKKNITFTVSMVNHERTITGVEANEVLDAVAAAAFEAMGAERV